MTAGAAIGACSASPASPDPDESEATPTPGTRTVLLAYFSRPGENYYNGGRRNIEVGTPRSWPA